MSDCAIILVATSILNVAIFANIFIDILIYLFNEFIYEFNHFSKGALVELRNKTELLGGHFCIAKFMYRSFKRVRFLSSYLKK